MPASIPLAVAVFMLLMGAGIAGLWTIDILRSPEVDRSSGLLRARDRSTGSLLVPHWLAEYGTALALALGALGVLANHGSAAWLVPLALGALAYTSLNSLGWVLADRSRTTYAIPMVVGLAGALVAIWLLAVGALALPGAA